MTTAILVLGVLLAQPPAPKEPRPAPIADTSVWRQKREADLLAERGWLAVSGLPWLKEGETSVGSGEGNVIRLADGPARWGVFIRTGNKVEARPIDGPARELDSREPPFQIGRTWVQLIRRADRVGLRLWDPLNARKLAFPGLKWYPVKAEYKVRGRLIPAASPTTVKIANVIGQVNDYISPGIVEFELGGRKLRLTPVYETDAQDELFYIFKDATAGKTTYGAGRFVYSELPDKDGNVVIDFNRAYSPPCAYTDFATCPLPPAENRLEFAVEAGELDPHPHSGR
jgi:uncharacterized protein (DUF1684 family)